MRSDNIVEYDALVPVAYLVEEGRPFWNWCCLWTFGFGIALMLASGRLIGSHDFVATNTSDIHGVAQHFGYNSLTHNHPLTTLDGYDNDSTAPLDKTEMEPLYEDSFDFSVETSDDHIEISRNRDSSSSMMPWTMKSKKGLMRSGKKSVKNAPKETRSKKGSMKTGNKSGKKSSKKFGKKSENMLAKKSEYMTISQGDKMMSKKSGRN